MTIASVGLVFRIVVLYVRVLVEVSGKVYASEGKRMQTVEVHTSQISNTLWKRGCLIESVACT